MTTKTKTKTTDQSLPMPTTPTRLPIVRLKRVRDGVIGYPWLEILHIVGMDYKTFRYLCRLPEHDGTLGLCWLAEIDLFGAGDGPPEYEDASSPVPAY